MAPKKRNQPEPPTPTQQTNVRVTRSMALANTRLTRSAARRASTSGSATAHVSLPDTHSPDKKRKKATNTKPESSTSQTPNQSPPAASDNSTIIIEHCTEMEPFKTRAEEAKSGLEKKVPGITVTLNPETPRKGCFEIREDGEEGEKFISLLAMKPPFIAMMNLDMDKVVTEIAEKIASRAN